MSTSRLVSRRRQEQGFKWARIAMSILATIGVIDTGSITLTRLGWLGKISCPGGSEGCDKVLNSPWGTIFQGNGWSIPLSLVGCISYLCILGMAIVPLLPGLAENKTNLSRRTWWGLFVLSCGMSSFSLILLWLMIFKIKAFCFFCLLSACISITLLVLTLIGGGWDDRGQLFFRGILLTLGILLGSFIWAANVDPTRSEVDLSSQGLPPIVETKSTSSQISLARHLKAKNAVMYSAYWCPHCHDQKELFGKEATAELLIVECAEDGQNSQRDLCLSKGITGFPSWEINGQIEAGIKQLNELANFSKYNGNQKF